MINFQIHPYNPEEFTMPKVVCTCYLNSQNRSVSFLAVCWLRSWFFSHKDKIKSFVLLFILSLFVDLGCEMQKNPDFCNADEYTQNNAPQFVNSTKKLHLLNLKGDESLLDFGCREGKITNYMCKQYIPLGTIHGVDSSGNFIKHAQQFYGHKPRISFEQTDVTNYTSTKKYDAVTSFMLLHWVEDYEKILQNIFDALKPGGKALIMTLAETELNFFKAIKEVLQEETWKNYGKNYQFPIYTRSHEQIMSAAQAAGLKINHLELVLDTANFKDESAYQHHYQAMPLTICIPAEKKEDFFKQAAERSLPHETLHPDGSITVHGYVLYMVLEKPKT